MSSPDIQHRVPGDRWFAPRSGDAFFLGRLFLHVDESAEGPGCRGHLGLLVAMLARVEGPGSPGLEALAVLFLAVFLFVCGLQHFVYADFVTALVPSWIPGQRFWTYLTGMAPIAGGAGILVPPLSAMAATLTAAMLFLWVLLLHIPRAVAGADHAGETAGVFEALAISGIALLAAYRSARAAARRRPA